MPIKQLKPILDRKIYSAEVEKDLLQQLWDVVFKPIFEILGSKKPARVNSMADLKTAFRSGRIFWQEGHIYGQFNSVIGGAIRSLGGIFIPSRKCYKIDLNKIPMDLRTDIVIGKGMNRDKTEKILKALKDAQDMKIMIGRHGILSFQEDLNKQAITTFKVLPNELGIPLDLSDKQKEDLAESYTNNLDLYINDWKEEAIERLREKTQANAALGYRSDRLATIVKTEFGVSKNKAKFLAMQETALFVSKYREERYTGAGIKEYIWSTSLDERVRPDHKALHHQKFSWDSPPVVDRATGRRGNPGTDFGCRCLALPVIRLGV